MNDREFEDAVDAVFDRISDDIDALDYDLDVDSSGNILSVTFPNASVVVVSRQVANHEIWVAAKSGGFHLAFSGGDWSCGTTGESLSELLGRIFTEQLGAPVALPGS